MMMKTGKLIVTLLVAPVWFAGCDIFEVDNMDPPESELTGQIVFNGEPIGVRNPSGSAQLLLWQADWDLNNPNRISSSIPVYLNPSGDFSARLFDGEYEVEVVNNSGPWQNNPTRLPVSVRGDTHFNVDVSPYYTVLEPNLSYSADPAPGGSITATFNVGQHVTSPLLDLVGVYVNTTTFVDRTRRVTFVEQTRSEIQTELDANGSISVTVNLPSDIHVTHSPDRREFVYARIGVKAAGVTESAYSQIYKIPI